MPCFSQISKRLYEYGPFSSTPSADAAVSFNYLLNSANQRTTITNADNSRWVYTYDALGQVVSGRKYWGDGTPAAGQQFDYTFDDIGNRKTAASGGDQNGANLRSANYANDSLNRLTSRSVPGYLNILGEATNTATVTLWSSSGAYAATSRKSNYFRGELLETNATALWLTITNLAVLNNGTNADIVTNTVGNMFLAQTPEAFGYDADGNLTNDGRWVLTWDAENRLTKAESLASAPTASKRKVEWTYDYAGRRIQQATSDGSSGSYVVTENLKFVSDGWRHLTELNATNNALIRSYIWGLDLSGSLDGAGGVGGLLMLNNAANGVHFYAFDGNGNVAALVKASDGTTTANYEYDPFGQTIRATGMMARENPFRFSTKRANETTDFVLYEYRFYKPSTGTWLNRDPIEEEGGLNLYGMVGNDPLNRIDLFGLADTELHHVIPEWLARYSAYGARGQGFCIRLTQQFHRGPGGLETELTQIRNLLRSGAIDQFGAYNRVLLAQLRNLPAIIRNNRAAVGISGGSAFAFRGTLRAGLAQFNYNTYGAAARGATGIGLVAFGAYFYYDTRTQIADLDNYSLEQEGDIDAYNRQIDLARRASDRDISLILNTTSGMIRCSNQQGQSACADKFKRAMSRNYYFIETIGVSPLGISARQARDTVSEQLFGEYLQCLKKAGCCIPGCN